MTSSAAAFAEELEGLRERYARELPAKARSVARAARRVAARWDGADLAELVREVHRLTGSAAIYGFAGVSRAACDLEDYLEAVRRRRVRRGSGRDKELKRLSEALLGECSTRSRAEGGRTRSRAEGGRNGR